MLALHGRVYGVVTDSWFDHAESPKAFLDLMRYQNVELRGSTCTRVVVLAAIPVVEFRPVVNVALVARCRV